MNYVGKNGRMESANRLIQSLLSHTLYQIKKSKNWQIYDEFGFFRKILEKIVNNKSGNHNNLCLLVLAWTAPRSSKQRQNLFLVLVNWHEGPPSSKQGKIYF